MTSLLSMAYGLVNKRSLDSKQKTGNIEGIALLYNNLSELYREQGDYPRCL
jgi:hypothetical protein